MEQQELDAIIISHPENRAYLSGFTGSDGWLFISKTTNIIAVDFRYVEQAKLESPEFEMVHVKGGINNWLTQLILKLNIINLGFEANVISFSTYQQLCNSLNHNKNINLISTKDIVETLRATKESKEIENICNATEIADKAIEHVKSVISPGKSEREIAWEIEKFLRESGSDHLPFNVIVASGPNSALPHAKPSERKVLANEPIVVDIGAKINGYCSDLSRTFCCGTKNEQFSKLYNLVLGAQLTAINTIESGMNGNEADRQARSIIEQANYGELFGHGLGHGIGLMTHEAPRLGANSMDKLADHMVFSIEPGIYVSGWGGIRIEDTVMLENDKVRVLTKSSKNPCI